MKENRLWVVGAIAAIAVIVIGGWLLVVSPKLAEGDLAASQQVDVESLNATQQAQVALLREQSGKLDQLKTDLAELQKAIPASQKVDEFIDAVQGAADTAGVVLTKVEAGEAGPYGITLVTDGTTPTPPVDGAPAAPTAPDDAFTVGVTIVATGTPDAVIRFSKLVQEASRIITVVNFTYAPEDSAGTLTGFIFVVDATKSSKAIDAAAGGTATSGGTTQPTPQPGDPTPTPAQG